MLSFSRLVGEALDLALALWLWGLGFRDSSTRFETQGFPFRCGQLATTKTIDAEAMVLQLRL